MRNPFRYYKTSPEVIRLAVMMYVRFPLSLRQVEALLHERGYRHQLRNGSCLVEPVRPVVCRGDKKEPLGRNAKIAAVEVAFG